MGWFKNHQLPLEPWTPTTHGKMRKMLHPRYMFFFFNPKKCSRHMGRLGRFLLGPIDVRGRPTRWGVARGRERLFIPSPKKKSPRKKGRKTTEKIMKENATLNWLFPKSNILAYLSQHKQCYHFFLKRNMLLLAPIHHEGVYLDGPFV